MANTHSLDLEASSNQFAYIADGSQSGLDINSDHSFETNAKFETLPSVFGDSFAFMTKWWDADGGERQYRFFINTDNKLVSVFTDGSGNMSSGETDASLSIATGIWYHLAVTVDISVPTMVFYFDGSAVASSMTLTAATSIRTDGSADFAIGAVNANGTNESDYFDGLLDDVRFWNDIRTANEIANNRRRELSGSEGGLLGYWKLNEDYVDATGNNNLTGHGSPVFSKDRAFKESYLDLTSKRW